MTTARGGQTLRKGGPGSVNTDTRGADGCVESNMPGPHGLSEAVHSSMSAAIFHQERTWQGKVATSWPGAGTTLLKRPAQETLVTGKPGNTQ